MIGKDVDLWITYAAPFLDIWSAIELTNVNTVTREELLRRFWGHQNIYCSDKFMTLAANLYKNESFMHKYGRVDYIPKRYEMYIDEYYAACLILNIVKYKTGTKYLKKTTSYKYPIIEYKRVLKYKDTIPDIRYPICSTIFKDIYNTLLYGNILRNELFPYVALSCVDTRVGLNKLNISNSPNIEIQFKEIKDYLLKLPVSILNLITNFASNMNTEIIELFEALIFVEDKIYVSTCNTTKSVIFNKLFLASRTNKITTNIVVISRPVLLDSLNTMSTQFWPREWVLKLITEYGELNPNFSGTLSIFDHTIPNIITLMRYGYIYQALYENIYKMLVIRESKNFNSNMNLLNQVYNIIHSMKKIDVEKFILSLEVV